MTPGSLECASLTTWSAQLTAVEAHAAERDRFGTELVAQVAEPLKVAAVQYEDLRKCHADYYAKLEKERDASYGDLKKVKGKYDAACQEVENRRKKMESSFDHGKAKAQNAYQQQILEMNNVKVRHCALLILRRIIMIIMIVLLLFSSFGRSNGDFVEYLPHQHQCDE